MYPLQWKMTPPMENDRDPLQWKLRPPPVEIILDPTEGIMYGDSKLPPQWK
jgi:hypothetical protein